MGRKIKLPVGIEDFKEIRQEEFYYIDKTKLLEQLLEKWGKVNLFTRPRRFGKTLNTDPGKPRGAVQRAIYSGEAGL